MVEYLCHSAQGTGATYGTCLINLKPWAEREQSVEEVIALGVPASV